MSDPSDAAASDAPTAPRGEDVRILVEGALTADVLMELEGFGVRAEHPFLRLAGTLPDQAALAGALRRLHAAGLTIRSVERRRPPLPEPDAPAVDDAARGRLARIEVEGRVSALMEQLTHCVVRREAPRASLEVRVADDNDLFAVLDDLEALGLAVWAVDARE